MKLKLWALASCICILVPATSQAKDEPTVLDVHTIGGRRPPRPRMPEVHEACSFLVGQWNGVMDDGTKCKETWMPILNNSTVGIRASAARNSEVFEIYSGNDKVPHLRMHVSAPDSASVVSMDGVLDARAYSNSRMEFVFKSPSSRIKGVQFTRLSADHVIQGVHCGEGSPIVQTVLTRVAPMP